MAFWLDWLWWVLLAAAAVSFGISNRPGMVIPAPVKKIGRAVFFTVVILAFLRTGWPGGLALCLGGGVAGLLVPFLIASKMNKSTPAAPQVPAQRLDPVLPSMGQTATGQTATGQTATGQTATGQTARGQTAMGRTAILRDMAQNGISRTKVRQLIYHGRLLAFEDPKDGKISLVRPEDLEAMGVNPMNPDPIAPYPVAPYPVAPYPVAPEAIDQEKEGPA